MVVLSANEILFLVIARGHAKFTSPIMKGVIYMTIVKRILSGLVIFIAGLEVGGFGIWYLTMKAINESSSRRTSRNYASYKDYH